MTGFIIAGIFATYAALALVLAHFLDLFGDPFPRISNGFDIAAGLFGLSIFPAVVGALIAFMVGLVSLL